MVKGAHRMNTDSKSIKNSRIKEIFDVIIELALGNFEARGTISELDDEYDGIITGLNALSEELQSMKVQLVRKERLSAIGMLASTIAHELRNPLGVISNSVYYLKMKLKSMDEKVKKHLNILQKMVEDSSRIISELTDFARLKSFSFVEVNINNITTEALDNIELPEKIILEKNLDVELPIIKADPNQIQRAFQNIILNAVQAIHERGKLEIKTLARKNLVEIIFKDTGVGISKENLQEIFEPLFTTKAKGFGLGLAIVKDIIDKHGGTIEVESEVDVGTTFIIKLPLRR